MAINSAGPAPLFVVSSGRAGSSAFARVLSTHPSLSFLTALNERFPGRDRWNRLALRALDIPGASAIAAKRVRPTEAYAFWEHHAHGFRRPSRDLVASDVTERTRSRLRQAVRANTVDSRPVFFAKLTGWPRLEYLREVFPDARFVHLVRDGRDVANSLLNVDFWDGWTGPPAWRLGPLPEDLDKEWLRADRSFVVLAGIYWKIVVNRVEAVKPGFGDDLLEIRYEDFVADPMATLRRVISHAGLADSAKFWREVRRLPITDNTGKFRKDLTTDQQRSLEECLAPELTRYGYL